MENSNKMLHRRCTTKGNKWISELTGPFNLSWQIEYAMISTQVEHVHGAGGVSSSKSTEGETRRCSMAFGTCMLATCLCSRSAMLL